MLAANTKTRACRLSSSGSAMPAVVAVTTVSCLVAAFVAAVAGRAPSS